tara:strand:+ start:1968 stop:2264 length:297 start_codon:yes stop_codon:yes gene_type:complete
MSDEEWNDEKIKEQMENLWNDEKIKEQIKEQVEKLDNYQRETVVRLREYVPELAGRTDEEIHDLYRYYSTTQASASWLVLNSTEPFRQFFLKMRHMFR